MNQLNKLPNIGKVLETKLIEVEITSKNKLVETGSRGAFVRIKALDSSACINMLYALEGAVQGVRWHDLNPVVKEELKLFFRSL